MHTTSQAKPAKIVEHLLEIPDAWLGRDALASSEGSLTFLGLREGMLRTAAWLRANAVRPGDIVALCLPKCLAAVQIVYGVLASGAVYAPLQFNGPVNRLGAILQSLRPRLVLTTPEMAGRLARELAGSAIADARIISLTLNRDEIESLSRGLQLPTATVERGPDDLAVIYFTSGSTGQPKGVMWSRRAMAVTMQRPLLYHHTSASDRLISHTGLHYSLSIDILYPLLCGCRLYLLADREAMIPERVAATLEREQITTWISSASLLRLLVEEGNLEGRRLDSMRYVEFLGEPMAIPTLRRLMVAFPKARFVNSYGATEAPDIAYYHVQRPLPDDLAAVPLGRSPGNYEFHLRDENGAEAREGESGEICVIGPQVMSGYWNDDEQTALRRLDGRANSYRTGDYARRGTDGILYMIGRRDNLVKLHGNRFDLGEVGAVLKSHPSVREAAVFAIAAASGLGDKEVCAAVQVDASLINDPRLADDLRRLCRDSLPNFARPTRIMVLANLPLLSSGKIDRKELERQLYPN